MDLVLNCTSSIMLKQDMPVFLARQGHPLTLGPRTLQDLLEYPWVLPAQPNIVRQQLEFAARDIGATVSFRPVVFAGLTARVPFGESE